MGLDTSHDCWHGPYSQFNKWRNEVCLAADLGSIYEYNGFGGDKEFDHSDPLTILLYHSDCDGDIKWQDCNDLADRLEEVLPNVRSVKTEDIRFDYYKARVDQFIDGLREAYNLKEDVDFH